MANLKYISDGNQRKITMLGLQMLSPCTKEKQSDISDIQWSLVQAEFQTMHTDPIPTEGIFTLIANKKLFPYK